uniref:Glypican 5c n=1 Tax=Lepisosteus oculatus TaxID=7918 RepID=W5MEL9_LEPOC|nr:PREDICTED: glypican-5-like isoform X1 [Lepisosteus oculatus]
MSRGIFSRVVFWWILVAVALLTEVSSLRTPSCHEVKTAFQLRHIGPLKWVPETPGTVMDLQVCKNGGPTCCTRKMEESYQAAVRREALQHIRSYSFELKYLIMGHATTLQDTFQSLISFTRNHTSSLFDSAYKALAREARAHVTELFTDLAHYILGANSTVESAVQRFYDNLFPLVYNRLINPGITELSPQRSECLRMTRQDVNPFGPHPHALAQDLARSLRAGHAFSRALSMGAEVMNKTENMTLTRECGRALVRMQYCSHCQGLTLIKPCAGYCLNVMRGCLASLSELDQPWRSYIATLEDLTNAMAGAHDLELSLLGIRNQINDAILYTQLHGPRLTAIVDKVCGSSAEGGVRPSPLVMTSSDTPEPPAEGQYGHMAHLSSLPLKPSKNDKPRSLKKISREFMSYMQRYKSFFATLPEILCEGEMVQDGFTCWSGEDVVESYTGRLVGNGILAQKQNPEMKVRGPDPMLSELKERLEHFNQKLHGRTPRPRVWAEAGSGTQEGSADCDDEDGCQGSGEGSRVESGVVPRIGKKEKSEQPDRETSRGREKGEETTQRTTTLRTPKLAAKGTACSHGASPLLLGVLFLSALERQLHLL